MLLSYYVYGIILGGASIAYSEKAIWKEKFKNTYEKR